jgi:hypothetical protein
MLWRFSVRDWGWIAYQAEYVLEFVFLGVLLALLAIKLPRRPQVLFLMLAIGIYSLTPLPAMIYDRLWQGGALRSNPVSPAVRIARDAAPWVHPCVTLALFAAVWWCLVRAVFGTSGLAPTVPPAQEISDVDGSTNLVS